VPNSFVREFTLDAGQKPTIRVGQVCHPGDTDECRPRVFLVKKREETGVPELHGKDRQRGEQLS